MLFLYIEVKINTYLQEKEMVKTVPLVIGAGVLTTTILILYNISQPTNNVIKFLRFNLTNNDRNMVSGSKQNILVQEFRPQSPKSKSLAQKLFDKELSRISKNLRDGNIADYAPEPPSVVYVNSNDAKIVGFAQTFQDLQNHIANGQQLNGFEPHPQLDQNFHYMQMPNIPNSNQNVYKPVHILSAPKDQNNQNSQLTNENQQNPSPKVPIEQNNQNVPVQQNNQNVPTDQNNHNVPVEQNNQQLPVQQDNQNVPVQNNPTQQGWKVINPEKQVPGNPEGPHRDQLQIPAAESNGQRPPDQFHYGPQSQGVWQTMKPASQLADLVQQADAV